MPRLPVCPHCGYKKVEPIDSFYHCPECLSDFGRIPLSDAGEPMLEAVSGLRFRYGDFISGSVRLRFVQEDGNCLYEVYDANEGGIDKYADLLTMEEWTALKKVLLEDLYVYDWEKEYIPVNDGRILGNNEWEFSVIVSDDEEYTYRGFDAYPVYWDKFLEAMDPFFRKLEQH